MMQNIMLSTGEVLREKSIIQFFVHGLLSLTGNPNATSISRIHPAASEDDNGKGDDKTGP